MFASLNEEEQDYIIKVFNDNNFYCAFTFEKLLFYTKIKILEVLGDHNSIVRVL